MWRSTIKLEHNCKQNVFILKLHFQEQSLICWSKCHLPLNSWHRNMDIQFWFCHTQQNIHLNRITIPLRSHVDFHVPISVHCQLNIQLNCITFSLRSHVPISVHLQLNIHSNCITFSLWSHVPISVHCQLNIHLNCITFPLRLMSPYMCTSN